MSPQEVAAYLERSRTVIFTTIGPEGVPDPVGMWFVQRDGDMWMRTYAKSQKVTNLRRDPRVAILAEDGERYSELRGVQITGRVELVTDVEVICDIVVGLMEKYEGLDPDHGESVRAAYRATAAKQVAIKVVPERIVSWDHSKMVG